MNSVIVPFRLPLDDAPRLVFESDDLFEAGQLRFAEEVIVRFDAESSRPMKFAWRDHAFVLTLPSRELPDPSALQLTVDDDVAVREDRVSLRPSRSAWLHAIIALLASVAGFIASYLYLHKAEVLNDAWAMKMGIHTAGWHLLLTLTLFPASVWGQRRGIRAVQFVSFVFFAIHAGMAIANVGENSGLEGPWIATFNALSGIFFLGAVVYGQWAYRDMNPRHSFGASSGSISIGKRLQPSGLTS